MRFIKISLFVAASAILAFAAAQESPLLLRRQLTENSSENFKMVIKTSQVVDIGVLQMPIEGTVTADLAMKTLKVDSTKKECEVEIKVSNLKVDIGDQGAGGGAMPELPKEAISTGTIDERNRLKLMPQKSGDGTASGMAIMLGMLTGTGDPAGSLGIEFPEKAVKIGDTWEVAIPKNPFMGEIKEKLTSKLVGEKEMNGMRVYEVLITGKIPFDVDTEKLVKANPELVKQNPMLAVAAIMKGTVEVSMTCFVSKSSGATVQLESTQKLNSTIDVPAHGVSGTITGSTKTSITKQ